MRFPFDDWQFWVTTIAALAAAIMILRALLPRSRRKGQRTQLTIGGKRPQR